MITITNRQRSYKLDIEHMKGDLDFLLKLLKYDGFDLGVLLTTNKTIRRYNKDYRHKDKPTDILSFPFHPTLQAGKHIRAHDPEDRNLGDLILSMEYIDKAAQKLGVPLNQRLRVLLIHGICHLLGYDHIEDADYRRMRIKEAWMLRELTRNRPL